MQDEFDFIIAGAGSAGCVLASRLSADGRFQVLLLEAGPTHRHPLVAVSSGFGELYYNKRFNWGLDTEPDPGIRDRVDYWPAGKVLGGSSSINGMVYIRGHRQDYDDWAALGNTGWGYDDVLPYFKKSEDNDAGADEFHGAGGPWKVSTIAGREEAATRLALESARAAGYPATPDFNGAQQEGSGLYQFNFRHGRRSSTATAFLQPARKRKNLTVVTGALVSRVVFDGARAVGVTFEHKRRQHSVECRREAIIAAGAIHSPAVLQRSGVGPGAVLRAAGVEVVHDSPAVGENLQDHCYTGVIYKTTIPTISDQLNSPFGIVKQGLKYVFTNGGGTLGMAINQGGAFVRTRPEEQRPDTQLYFFPMSFRLHEGWFRKSVRVDAYSGMTFNASPCRPESRGWIRIASGDAAAAPRIQPNYLSTEHDVRAMVDSLKICDEIARSQPFADIVEERMFLPAGDLTDRQWEKYARATGRTCYHPTSSCTMGTDASRSVVDPQLKVHGVEGLRVIDASIMPLMVSGNTAAAATMIGEKGADLVLADHR